MSENSTQELREIAQDAFTAALRALSSAGRSADERRKARVFYLVASLLVILGLLWGALLLTAPFSGSPEDTLTLVLMIIALAAIVAGMLWSLIIAIKAHRTARALWKKSEEYQRKIINGA